MKLTLFQHAWSARDLDPDGCAYGTEAEADAAEIRAARELLGDDYSAEDLADAIEQHTSADDVSAERFEEIRDGADLTDEEAKMAAEELRGYDSAVYPITVTLTAAPAPFAELVEAVLDLRAAVVPFEDDDDLDAAKARADAALDAVAEAGFRVVIAPGTPAEA